jgi:hypothetical protein
LPFDRQFFLTPDAFCVGTWVSVGYSQRFVSSGGWMERVDVKQDISRLFLSLFVFTTSFCLTWFRIASRNLVSFISRKPGHRPTRFLYS